MNVRDRSHRAPGPIHSDRQAALERFLGAGHNSVISSPLPDRHPKPASLRRQIRPNWLIGDW